MFCFVAWICALACSFKLTEQSNQNVLTISLEPDAMVTDLNETFQIIVLAINAYSTGNIVLFLGCAWCKIRTVTSTCLYAGVK